MNWYETITGGTPEQVISIAKKLGAVAVNPSIKAVGHDGDIEYIGVKFFDENKKLVLKFVSTSEDENYSMLQSVRKAFPDYVKKFYP